MMLCCVRTGILPTTSPSLTTSSWGRWPRTAPCRRRRRLSCTRRWCSPAPPGLSRFSGPGTVSRTPGGQSYTRTSNSILKLEWSTKESTQTSTPTLHSSVTENQAELSYKYFSDNAKLGKTCLEELIREQGCTDVFVCGIATDVCVGRLLGWLLSC